MEIALKKSFLKGSIDVLTSKSVAHRIMLCAAAANGETVIYGLNNSADVEATRRCLIALGAEFTEQTDGGCRVVPITQKSIVGDDALIVTDDKKTRAPVKLYCGESGSTLRFLIPYAAALGIPVEFYMEGRLPERPNGELLDVLEKHGIETRKNGSVLSVSGRLTAGTYRIGGKISSQFTSGLLMALPLVSGKSVVLTESGAESEGYVDITEDVIRKFSVNENKTDGKETFYSRVNKTETGYEIDGGAAYVSPKRITVEGDWSNAAFFIVAGVLNGDIVLKGLNPDSKQPDRAAVDILRRMGGNISFTGDLLTVKKSALVGTEIDARNIPDLVPVLAVAAGVAKGRTVFRNAGRLRLKESDRLEAVRGLLTACGGRARIEGDSLIIDGIEAYLGGTADSLNDHRIAMSAAVLSCASNGIVTVRGAEAVNKSYPDFFRDLGKMQNAF
ncbi:MAG: 3-phosphoshikimate 1-carboxyvinyltransferase [Clostridiales bacterium]|jgi:3-phosphoshikimate 1-carboxyvinyltransferase|nr:3-phosphoshikimate 1-carboxyvinyltransferase [Clostridiales bacterium]